jgi:predicted Rossmann-fold nucleotide-binding protein
VMFGGARSPAPENRESAKTPYLAELSQYYEEARKFAEIIPIAR